MTLIMNSATLDNLREDPERVLGRAQGAPVAIVRGSDVVACLVPPELVPIPPGHRRVTREEVMRPLEERREEVQPVLDWLRDE